MGQWPSVGCDPVGVVEIAQRLRVRRQTVSQWRVRGVFMVEPRCTVSGQPAWEWAQVAAWAEARAGVREGAVLPKTVESHAPASPGVPSA